MVPMALPKVKVLARLNLKSQPCWNQGPNSSFRGVRIQPVREQLWHLGAVLPQTWAKHLGYAQTLLKVRGLRQQELRHQAPNSKPESKGSCYTKQVPGALKTVPLPNTPSVCAPTYASCPHVKDALDTEIAKESRTASVPWNLGIPTEKRAVLLRMAMSYYPCGMAKWAQ